MTRSDVDLLKLAPVELVDRIASYLDDHPGNGGHSDAAGASAWELLQEAMDELRHSASASTAGRGEVVARKTMIPFVFNYENYRGEVSMRVVTPISVRFGSTDWHPTPQWLLLAFDHERQAEREFAMADMGSTVNRSAASPPAAETAGVKPIAPEPGWLAPALDSAAARAAEMPNWMVNPSATPADTSASVVGDREAIARIIDEHAFMIPKHPAPDDKFWRGQKREYAFAKADEILAALTSRGKADAGSGAGDCRMQEVLNFLNSIEGAGYGGMSSFEIARMNVRDALMRGAAQEAKHCGDDENRMEKISALIARLQSTLDRWGDTCVYIRRGGLSWGAVALNRQDDDRKHGVFDLQAQHDRDMEQRVGQVERLIADRDHWRDRAIAAEASPVPSAEGNSHD